MSKLSITNLRVWFPGLLGKQINVVRDVSLETTPGKTIGLVGESGSGKSMTALSLLGLVPYPGKTEGSIMLNDKELLGLNDEQMEKIRGAKISIVFQDPSSALDPVFTVEQQLIETIQTHKRNTLEEAKQQALDCLRMVDIPNAEKRIKNYPHEFSGGMKQRILIAMALACEPDVLILDEPTTALDVTVQAQLLDLIERIQQESNMSIILISHDLGIVAEIADEVAIMYAGRIVEYGSVKAILKESRHPYTKGLLDSIPKLGVYKTQLQAIGGFPPNPSELPTGCPFYPRCPNKIEKCNIEDPPYTQTHHKLACWNPRSLDD